MGIPVQMIQKDSIYDKYYMHICKLVKLSSLNKCSFLKEKRKMYMLAHSPIELSFLLQLGG